MSESKSEMASKEVVEYLADKMESGIKHAHEELNGNINNAFYEVCTRLMTYMLKLKGQSVKSMAEMSESPSERTCYSMVKEGKAIYFALWRVMHDISHSVWDEQAESFKSLPKFEQEYLTDLAKREKPVVKEMYGAYNKYCKSNATEKC